MSETKKIAAIHVVTDTENSYDQIGEVQGGFDDIQLSEHIEKYGYDSLLKTLAYMQWQVWDTVRRHNSEKGIQDAAG